jgi:Ser/Thr protein kinase RdoA (MazF antagonist)
LRTTGALATYYDEGMLDHDAQAVLTFYALDGGAVRRIEALGGAGGWSGSRLWRVVGDDGRKLCLRRWPEEHPTVERLQMIHAVLLRVAAGLPIVACPLKTTSGQTYVEHAGHLWELADWKPGKADYHADPSRARLRGAMQAIARFHEASSGDAPPPGLPQTIVDRWRITQEMQCGGIAAIEQAVITPLGNEIDLRAGRLLKLARQTLHLLHATAPHQALERLSVFPVIRDIHHDHVLFTGDEVTGLIDFGALRVDTPLTDVARLVGSLVGDDREARQFALDAYSEIRPLNEADRRLIDYLDESGLVLGGLNWLTWLYVERRDMGPVGAIVRRLDEILKRLEAGASR